MLMKPNVSKIVFQNSKSFLNIHFCIRLYSSSSHFVSSHPVSNPLSPLLLLLFFLLAVLEFTSVISTTDSASSAMGIVVSYPTSTNQTVKERERKKEREKAKENAQKAPCLLFVLFINM